MIEKTLLDYLKNEIEAAVYIDVPANPPVKRVVIEKTGGGMEEHIRHSVITIQSYAPRRFDAAVLNDEVVCAMLEAVELPEISSVELNADYDYTNTATKEYRYQAVFDVVHY